MIISVITVCYNAEKLIEKTFNSVTQQSYGDIEYLIVDGGSTDRTLLIADKYAQEYSCIRVVSGHDNGIYDAMNKGVRECTGEYIIFLNAGDEFADNRVLDDTVAHINEYMAAGKGCDIIYGDFYDGAKRDDRLVTYGRQLVSNTYMLLSNTICHQAIFAGKQYLTEHPFDLSYRYVADRKWISECLKAGAVFRYMNRAVVVYDRTGVSTDSDNRQALRKEVDRYLEQMYPVRGRIINFVKRSEVIRGIARKGLKGSR